MSEIQTQGQRRRVIDPRPGDGPLEGAIRDGLFGTTGDLASLAEEIGVSYHTLWSWRAGRRMPPPDQVRRLARVLERRGGEVLGCARRLREFAASTGDTEAAV